MIDKKLTIPELINFHRSMAIRELALATSYPRTHTGIAAHPKLTGDGGKPEVRRAAQGAGWHHHH